MQRANQFFLSTGGRRIRKSLVFGQVLFILSPHAGYSFKASENVRSVDKSYIFFFTTSSKWPIYSNWAKWGWEYKSRSHNLMCTAILKYSLTFTIDTHLFMMYIHIFRLDIHIHTFRFDINIFMICIHIIVWGRRKSCASPVAPFLYCRKLNHGDRLSQASLCDNARHMSRLKYMTERV